ncbi:DUF29 domain-containing protein [Acuticoccus sp.]|uniref:DUF29 domain-containing protein n=1 Tax=Acuticoccus sp. TaxID=1904378 RepID=UPI003B51FF2F
MPDAAADTLALARHGYDVDFFLWTQEQAARLRARADATLDWANLAEEIEGLGKRDRREVDSRLEVLLLHLVKWQYQREARSAGWIGSIREQRRNIERIVEDSPSLRQRPSERLSRAYAVARSQASIQMGLLGLDQLPVECPFAIADVLRHDWLP